MAEELQHWDDVDLDKLTLDELAQYVQGQHSAGVRAAVSAVRHALHIGEALLVVRSRVAFGEYGTWVDANCDFSRDTASKYVRIAYHRESLSSDLIDGNRGFQASGVLVALNELRGLPAVPPLWGHTKRKTTEIDHRVARQMRDAGHTYPEIAAAFGVSETAARYWVDERARRVNKEAQRRRSTRLRAARRALEEKDRKETRASAARTAGGAIAEAYATLRVHLEAIDRAVRESNDDARACLALRVAQDHAYKAEDKIAEALRVS